MSLERKLAFAALGLGGGFALYKLYQRPGSRGGSREELPKLLSTVAMFREGQAPPHVFDAFAACRAKVLGRSTPDIKYRGPPFDAMDCGEDAMMLSTNLLAIADGVGGWRSHGVDPSIFANELMSRVMSRATTPRSYPAKPKQLLQEAHDDVVNSKAVTSGSSTAVLAGLMADAQGSPILVTANIGDSGILVVRDGAPTWRAGELQHRFNAPFQLAASKQPGRLDDSPSDALAQVFQLREGDLVVLGSDGLFDNLFDDDIAKAVSGLAPVPGTSGKYEGKPLTLREGAEAVLKHAVAVSTDESAVVPFMLHARDAGKKYRGGKVDDITVIVGRVTKVV